MLKTVERNKIRIAGTFKFWKKNEIPLENKRDIIFARTREPWGELDVVEFREPKDIISISNVHMFKKGLEDMSYRCMQSEIPEAGPVHPKST